MTKMNSLFIMYNVISNMTNTGQLLELTPSELGKINDRYVIMHQLRDSKMGHVIIHEIMYQDIEADKKALEEYQRLKDMHGSDVVDQIFPKTDEDIKRKILNTINFALDKVYKCNSLEILFRERTNRYSPVPGVSNAIYNLLQEEFDITSEKVINLDYYITINRRNSHDRISS